MGRPKGSRNLPKDNAEPIENEDAAPVLAATLLDEWIEDSIPCRYVRFSKVAVSPAKGKEPVWEFKLDPKTKYSVDAMLYHQDGGLIFTAYGQKCVVAPANIGYWWPL